MKKETIYIAGPMCFYADGYPRWDVMKFRAQTKGYHVAMPSDVVLDLTNEDLRQNAVTIFKNCARAMNEATAIICNLEFYRGADVDGGSIYEIGMAYAKGAHCYAYTRDKRPMFWKYQGYSIKDGKVYDRKGRVLPFGELPFSPNVMGSCKVVEGDFDDALEVFTLDMEEKRKRAAFPAAAPEPKKTELNCGGMPVVYLAGPERYDSDAAEKYAAMKALCARNGFYAIVPTDEVPGIPAANTDDIYTNAYLTFLRQQQHVRDCDIILANLNDFHGWEPDSDTSFECGMAFQLGKKMFSYMESTEKMIHRVPNFGADHDFRDHCGCNAENFDYPINLMFSGSMPVFEGDFEAALNQMIAALKAEA